MQEADDLATRVLVALVEGYAARDGMKDRLRALNEWEIARRSGYVDLSYVEYLEHPLRDEVANALLALQRQGLVSVWDRGIKYDSFVPTATGTESATQRAAPRLPELASDSEPGVRADVVARIAVDQEDQDQVLTRLDEIIRLLRSIDARLAE